ncbi:MAG: hypothetical protein ACRCWQ_06870 [Bacilli bacterium]
MMRSKKLISLLVMYGNVVVGKKDKKTQKVFEEFGIGRRKFHELKKVGNERKEYPRKDYSAFIYEATKEQREQLKQKYGAKLCTIR